MSVLFGQFEIVVITQSVMTAEVSVLEGRRDAPLVERRRSSRGA
jgi:hypothetical protein